MKSETILFKLEKLQEDFPIGKQVKWVKKVEVKKYYYMTPEELEAYCNTYKNFKIIDDHTILVSKEIYDSLTVDAWIFNGVIWRPAKKSGDEYLVFDEDDLNNWYRYKDKKFSF